MAGEQDQAKWVGTRKVYPAVTDLQAPESMVAEGDTLVVALGSEYFDLYTVPAGKILVLNNISGSHSAATPTIIMFYVKVDAVYHYFYIAPYGGAWEWHCFNCDFPVDEGNKIGVRLVNVINGETKSCRLFGYLCDKY